MLNKRHFLKTKKLSLLSFLSSPSRLTLVFSNPDAIRFSRARGLSFFHLLLRADGARHRFLFKDGFHIDDIALHRLFSKKYANWASGTDNIDDQGVKWTNPNNNHAAWNGQRTRNNTCYRWVLIFERLHLSFLAASYLLSKSISFL